MSKKNLEKILISFPPLIIFILTFFSSDINKSSFYGITTYTEYSWNNITTLPLYPYFLKAIFAIFGDLNWHAVLIFQLVMCLITFFFLRKIILLLDLKFNIFVILSFMMSLNIYYRFNIFLPNGMYIFLFVLMIYNFLNYNKKLKFKNFIKGCILISLLILTRPMSLIFVILVSPFFFIYLCKIKKLKLLIKLRNIIVFFTLILIGFGLQSFKYYSNTGKIGYVDQTSGHLALFTVPCLAQKFACGKANAIYKQKIIDELKIIKKEKLKITKQDYYEIAKKYFLTIDKNTIFFSVIFGYLKLMLHSPLLELFQYYNLNIFNFSDFKNKNFFIQLYNFGENIYLEKHMFVWLFSQIWIVIERIVQIFGIIYLFKTKPYLSILLILICISFAGPSIGIGNPRYRSEIEPILIIFFSSGVFYLDNLRKRFKFFRLLS